MACAAVRLLDPRGSHRFAGPLTYLFLLLSSFSERTMGCSRCPPSHLHIGQHLRSSSSHRTRETSSPHLRLSARLTTILPDQPPLMVVGDRGVPVMHWPSVSAPWDFGVLPGEWQAATVSIVVVFTDNQTRKRVDQVTSPPPFRWQAPQGAQCSGFTNRLNRVYCHDPWPESLGRKEGPTNHRSSGEECTLGRWTLEGDTGAILSVAICNFSLMIQ